MALIDDIENLKKTLNQQITLIAIEAIRINQQLKDSTDDSIKEKLKDLNAQIEEIFADLISKNNLSYEQRSALFKNYFEFIQESASSPTIVKKIAEMLIRLRQKELSDDAQKAFLSYILTDKSLADELIGENYHPLFHAMAVNDIKSFLKFRLMGYELPPNKNSDITNEELLKQHPNFYFAYHTPFANKAFELNIGTHKITNVQIESVQLLGVGSQGHVINVRINLKNLSDATKEYLIERTGSNNKDYLDLACKVMDVSQTKFLNGFDIAEKLKSENPLKHSYICTFPGDIVDQNAEGMERKTKIIIAPTQYYANNKPATAESYFKDTAEELRRNPKLAPQYVKEITTFLNEAHKALNQFHEDGFVHLDISLRNYLMSDVAKLADYDYSHEMKNYAVEKVEIPDTGPLKSMDIGRIYKNTISANSDSYAFRIMIFEIIGILLNKRLGEMLQTTTGSTDSASIANYAKFIHDREGNIFEHYINNARIFINNETNPEIRYQAEMLLKNFSPYLLSWKASPAPGAFVKNDVDADNLSFYKAQNQNALDQITEVFISKQTPQNTKEIINNIIKSLESPSDTILSVMGIINSKPQMDEDTINQITKILTMNMDESVKNLVSETDKMIENILETATALKKNKEISDLNKIDPNDVTKNLFDLEKKSSFSPTNNFVYQKLLKVTEQQPYKDACTEIRDAQIKLQEAGKNQLERKFSDLFKEYDELRKKGEAARELDASIFLKPIRNKRTKNEPFTRIQYARALYLIQEMKSTRDEIINKKYINFAIDEDDNVLNTMNSALIKANQNLEKIWRKFENKKPYRLIAQYFTDQQKVDTSIIHVQALFKVIEKLYALNLSNKSTISQPLDAIPNLSTFQENLKTRINELMQTDKSNTASQELAQYKELFKQLGEVISKLKASKLINGHDISRKELKTLLALAVSQGEIGEKEASNLAEKNNSGLLNFLNNRKALDSVIATLDKEIKAKSLEIVRSSGAYNILETSTLRNGSIKNYRNVIDQMALKTKTKGMSKKEQATYTHELRALSIHFDQFAKEMANQLIELDRQYFVAIEPEAITNLAFSYPNRTKAENYFQAVQRTVMTEILILNNVNDRALTVKYWITVAKNCYENGELPSINMARAIYRALSAHEITRLNRTFGALDEKSRNDLQQLELLCSDNNNDYANAYKFYKSHHYKVIPYVGNLFKPLPENVIKKNQTDPKKSRVFFQCRHTVSEMMSLHTNISDDLKELQATTEKFDHLSSNEIKDKLIEFHRDCRKLSDNCESFENPTPDEKKEAILAKKNVKEITTYINASDIKPPQKSLYQQKPYISASPIIIVSDENFSIAESLHKTYPNLELVYLGDKTNVPNGIQKIALKEIDESDQIKNDLQSKLKDNTRKFLNAKYVAERNPIHEIFYLEDLMNAPYDLNANLQVNVQTDAHQNTPLFIRAIALTLSYKPDAEASGLDSSNITTFTKNLAALIDRMTEAEFEQFRRFLETPLTNEKSLFDDLPKTTQDHIRNIENIKLRFDKYPNMETLSKVLPRIIENKEYEFIRKKEGGANSPGKAGGFYKIKFLSPDQNDPSSPKKIQEINLLFKHDTKIKNGKEVIHHDKTIGEFVTSRIMNQLIGNDAARLILARHNDKDPLPDPTGENIYIGSIFIHPQFQDFYKVMGLKERGPLAEEYLYPQFIKALGANNPQGKFTCYYENFPRIAAASLLTGNFDLHIGNFGTVPYKGKKKGYFKTLDFGAALDRIWDRKPLNHFLNFPRDMRVSPEFAHELLREASQDLSQNIKDTLDEVKQYYGYQPILEFANYIGMDTKDYPSENGNRDKLITDMKDYLSFKMQMRQKSQKELALEIMTSTCLIDKNRGTIKPAQYVVAPIIRYEVCNGEFNAPTPHHYRLDQLIEENPLYYLKGKFHFRSKEHATQLFGSEKMRISLDQQKKLTNLVNNKIISLLPNIIISAEASYNLSIFEAVLLNDALKMKLGAEQLEAIAGSYHQLLKKSCDLLTQASELPEATKFEQRHFVNNFSKEAIIKEILDENNPLHRSALLQRYIYMLDQLKSKASLPKVGEEIYLALASDAFKPFLSELPKETQDIWEQIHSDINKNGVTITDPIQLLTVKALKEEKPLSKQQTKIINYLYPDRQEIKQNVAAEQKKISVESKAPPADTKLGGAPDVKSTTSEKAAPKTGKPKESSEAKLLQAQLNAGDNVKLKTLSEEIQKIIDELKKAQQTFTDLRRFYSNSPTLSSENSSNTSKQQSTLSPSTTKTPS